MLRFKQPDGEPCAFHAAEVSGVRSGSDGVEVSLRSGQIYVLDDAGGTFETVSSAAAKARPEYWMGLANARMLKGGLEDEDRHPLALDAAVAGVRPTEAASMIRLLDFGSDEPSSLDLAAAHLEDIGKNIDALTDTVHTAGRNVGASLYATGDGSRGDTPPTPFGRATAPVPEAAAPPREEADGKTAAEAAR